MTAKAAVIEAFENLKAAYPDVRIDAHPDGQGGLWIEMHEFPVGPAYVPEHTFLVFNLPFNLPAADIYPLFVTSDLRRVDGGALGEGFAQTQLVWTGESTPRTVTQLSRRTRGNLFTAQSAAQKVAKVAHWLETR